MTDIVYYSYKKSNHSHVNDHELKRFDHSISSLRKFNNEIPIEKRGVHIVSNISNEYK